MSKELSFFIYLIERYAEAIGSSASDILKEWDDLQLTEYIHDMYEWYHIEAIENAFSDIEEHVQERKRQRYERSGCLWECI